MGAQQIEWATVVPTSGNRPRPDERRHPPAQPALNGRRMPHPDAWRRLLVARKDEMDLVASVPECGQEIPLVDFSAARGGRVGATVWRADHHGAIPSRL